MKASEIFDIIFKKLKGDVEKLMEYQPWPDACIFVCSGLAASFQKVSMPAAVREEMDPFLAAIVAAMAHLPEIVHEHPAFEDALPVFRGKAEDKFLDAHMKEIEPYILGTQDSEGTCHYKGKRFEYPPNEKQTF